MLTNELIQINKVNNAFTNFLAITLVVMVVLSEGILTAILALIYCAISYILHSTINNGIDRYKLAVGTYLNRNFRQELINSTYKTIFSALLLNIITATIVVIYLID